MNEERCCNYCKHCWTDEADTGWFCFKESEKHFLCDYNGDDSDEEFLNNHNCEQFVHEYWELHG